MAPESEKDFALEDEVEEDFNLEPPDPDANPEVDYEERFKDAKKDMKRKGKFTHEHDVEEFLRQYDNIAGMTIDKADGNLLHALIEMVKHSDDKVKSEDVELLVRRMVGKWPGLLEGENNDGYNPVFVAVRNPPHDRLAGFMVSACKDKRCLDNALSARALEGKTCLHVAFQKNINPKTTRMLVESASDDALAVQDNLGHTPMHYAMAFLQCTESRAEIIDLLIDRDLKALRNREETFLDLRSKSGNSVYMQHEQSRAPQFKSFVKFMDGKAQGAVTSKRSQALLADGAKKSAPRSAPKDLPQNKLKPSAEPDKPGNNGDAGDDGLDSLEKLRQTRKAEEAASRKKKAEETKTVTPIDEETRRPEDRSVIVGRHDDNMPNTQKRRTNTMNFDVKSEQERAKKEKRPVSVKSSSTQSKGQGDGAKKMFGFLDVSDTILRKLKLHYMRTRSAEMVISFLYGTNIDDVQISFDYDRLPPKMPWKEFLKRFGEDKSSGMKLDSVLQYVTFPRVEVIVKGRTADLEREAEIQSGIRQVGPLGRKDMQYFFDWLYKKGVRYIIRVSVEDSGDSGEKVHSDQAIQKSLERFIVEHLDWKKTDLDPQTILRVSSRVERELPSWEPPSWRPNKSEKQEIVADRQLRQLDLRWGGSNAVLRGWSEPEGLALLPQLMQIRLFKPPADKTYDNGPWIADQIKEFGTRLCASQKAARARALEPTAPIIPGVGDISRAFNPAVVRLAKEVDEQRKATSRDTSHLASVPAQGVNSHRWLESTARFAGEMAPFWQSTVNSFLDMKHNRAKPGTDGLENDVVLALIDDGVDRFDTLQSNQVLEGKSFDFHDGRVRPPYSSAKGHGTVMASMILRVCPMAKVYPIRLKTYDSVKGKNIKIDAGYAAQAIQAALDKKATIISMSWTIPMTENKSDAERKLHDVLDKAVKSGVLMFCSTPDKGKFTELDYPSGPWRDRFFRIGAAKADGTVFAWTPEDGITYVLPGVDVIRDIAANSSFDTQSVRNIPNRMVEFHETGSSVATALAAGLAAMIIYCVKASVLAVQTANGNHGGGSSLGSIPDDAAEEIAHQDEMKRAFASLGTVTLNKFVPIWEELDKISEHLETLRTPTSTAEVKDKATRAFVDFGLKLWSAAKNKHHH